MADEDVWKPNSTLVSQTWTARAVDEDAMEKCYKAKMLIK
jgi:hypothetical protein